MDRQRDGCLVQRYQHQNWGTLIAPSSLQPLIDVFLQLQVEMLISFQVESCIDAMNIDRSRKLVVFAFCY